MEFNYYSLSALFNAITSFFLGVLIFRHRSNSKTAKYLAVFCFSIFFWSVGYVLWQLSTSPDNALFWSRFFMLGAIFTAPTFLHLSIEYSEVLTKLSKKIVLLIQYGLAAIFVFANFSDLFVLSVEEKLNFAYWPNPGLLYSPFLILFFAEIVFGVFLLYLKWTTSTGDEQKNAKILVWSMVIAFAAGSTNFFLWYDIPIPPYGNAFVSLFVFILVRGVYRYNLFSLKKIASQALSLSLLVIFAFNFFLLEAEKGILLKTVFIFSGLYLAWLLIENSLEIEKKNEKLAELNQEKNDFMAIGIHQLRTPLTVISGYMELVRDGAFGRYDDTLQPILADIELNNERLMEIVDNFLNVQQIDSGGTYYDYQIQDIKIVVEDVVTQLGNHAKRRDIEIQIQVESQNIQFDYLSIRHTLQNIIGNAIKYGSGMVTIDGKKNGDSFQISITDQGPGFEEDGMVFFEKFIRANNSHIKKEKKGSGLGLYIAKKFVQANKGEVFAFSEGKNKGSTFGFRLPL